MAQNKREGDPNCQQGYLIHCLDNFNILFVLVLYLYRFIRLHAIFVKLVTYFEWVTGIPTTWQVQSCYQRMASLWRPRWARYDFIIESANEIAYQVYVANGICRHLGFLMIQFSPSTAFVAKLYVCFESPWSAQYTIIVQVNKSK